MKPDEKTGKAKLYSDIAMRARMWLWSGLVTAFGEASDVEYEKANRSIGHDFARIGLPKLSFAPIFETLRLSMPSIMTSASVTI